MHRYTVCDIMKLNPCEGYPRERVEKLWAGRESLSVREIAELDIPIWDRIWALCELATPRAARIFACDCAERDIQAHLVSGDVIDWRTRNAIIVSRLYADGKATEDDLRSADFNMLDIAAARYAVMGAAWPAVRSTSLPVTDTEAEWKLNRLVERIEVGK